MVDSSASISSPFKLLNTSTKVYPNEVKFFRFNKPIKIRKAGYEIQTESEITKLQREIPKEWQTPEDRNEENRARSLRKTRAAMDDYAKCNDFDKFATLTFDPKKHDAWNYDYCRKKVIAWLSNQQASHGAFRYLMVQEPMKDGKLHFHVLLGGFTGKYHPTGAHVMRKGKKCLRYKIDSWEKNYGFGDMEDIGNQDAALAYIMKYVKKELENETIIEKNKRRYWASKNLAKPSVSPDLTFGEAFTLAKSKGIDAKKGMESYENEWGEQITFKNKSE